MKKMLASVLFLLVPTLTGAGSLDSLEGWKEFSQRPALRPVFEKDATEGTLVISSPGEYRCNGAWKKSFSVADSPFYRFYGEYRTESVVHPRRSVLARVYWRDAEGRQVEKPEYPRLTGVSSSSWKILEDTLAVPPGAVTAEVELIFRWATRGKVEWKGVILAPASAPEPRPVTIGTLKYRHQESRGPEENLAVYGKYIEQAAARGVDILCLPEGMTLVGTNRSYLEVAEPVPGPTTRFLGELAKRHGIYLVAGILEKEGETAYNTAVFIGREGELIGRYRKVSLPREEIEGGLTPGEEFPVFDTDFGRIGILICWDLQFPEGARRLAARGAEIILVPIWGGTEALFPARAIENQVVLVTSSYDATTGIWNERGELVARAAGAGEVAVAEVDLNRETYWEWLGNLHARIPREAPVVEEVPGH